MLIWTSRLEKDLRGGGDDDGDDDQDEEDDPCMPIEHDEEEE